jgi:formylglycine-generating enzyme required for sulfatase activity
MSPESDQKDVIAPSGFTPLDQAGKAPRSQHRSGRALLYACLAAAALVLFFLLTARSVEIKVIAEVPADVSVSGLALPLGQRYLLRPGDYQVDASAPGYRPLSAAFSVDDGEDQSVVLTLDALPGRLSIDSTPSGATVLVDDVAVGQTPLIDLSLDKGIHALSLQEPRHLTTTQDIAITGRNVQQQLHIDLAPAWADISLSSTPTGATVQLDGAPVGQTPLTLKVLQGERTITLLLPAYAQWQQSLTVEAGKDADLGTIELLPAEGILALSSEPTGANVTLDGEFQGQTPLSLQLTPGSPHRLAVFKPGYKRFNETVELSAGATDQRAVTLLAQLGEVRFRISPSNAVLSINGIRRGKGGQTLSLPAVEHTIRVSLEGYSSVTRKVTPRPGLEQSVDVQLQTQQAAKLARIKPEITSPLGQTLLLFNPAATPLAEFTMGASRRDPGRRANEVLHPVALQRMFYLQTTEVTNAQFRQFQSSHNSGNIAGKSLNREHQPVVQVSWQQAAAFCNWLSAKQGVRAFYKEQNGIVTGFRPESTGYRLPSEAEWAWAARADGNRLLRFPWGDAFPPDKIVENYADSSSAYITGRVLNNYKDGHVVSAPVASFEPNQHRLYDMGGNVSEWVNNVYSIPPANGATQRDPLGRQGGDNYVIRGASWTLSKLSELRLSYRDYGQSGRDDVGFRIARYAE